MNNKKVFTIYLAIIIGLALITYFVLPQIYEGTDLPGVIGANVLLGLISFLSYRVVANSLKSDNPQAFIRGKYASTLIKFFSSLFIIGIYIGLNYKYLEKMNIIVILVFYVIYSIFEAAILSNLARKKPNNISQ